MRLFAPVTIAALALAGPALAQGGFGTLNGGYGAPSPAYAGGYGGQPGFLDADGPYGDAGPAYRSGWYDGRPMPAYSDDERWSGGDFYGTAEARDDDDLDLAAARTRPAVPPSRYADAESLEEATYAGRRPRGVVRHVEAAQHPRTARYAERVARWRARADACEAGDLSACRERD